MDDKPVGTEGNEQPLDTGQNEPPVGAEQNEPPIGAEQNEPPIGAEQNEPTTEPEKAEPPTVAEKNEPGTETGEIGPPIEAGNNKQEVGTEGTEPSGDKTDVPILTEGSKQDIKDDNNKSRLEVKENEQPSPNEGTTLAAEEEKTILDQQKPKSSLEVEISHVAELPSFNRGATGLDSPLNIIENEDRFQFTEMDEEILAAFKMSDDEFHTFDNPYMDSKVSLRSWRKDFRYLTKKTFSDDRSIDLVLNKLLDEGNFVVVYDQGTKKHRKMANLLFAVGEPFYLLSSTLLKVYSYNDDFWVYTMTDVYRPPFVLYGEKIYKDFMELEELLFRKIIAPPISPRDPDTMGDNEFHVVVVGCSSAGYAAALNARKYCERVALVEPVTSSGHAVRTAKKILVCTSGLLGRIRLAHKYGFSNTGKNKISWSSLIEQITDFIKKGRFERRLNLRKGGVITITARGKFGSENYLNLIRPQDAPRTSDPELQSVKGQYYIISTGSHQTLPTNIIGANEYCITTDRLFSRSVPPGDSLIIGNSSTVLECAGILCACEFKVTVIIPTAIEQSNLYEEGFLELIRKDLESQGVRFIDKCQVLRVSLSSETKKRTVEGIFEDGQPYEETFSTVIIDGRRVPSTGHLGLTRAKVKVKKTRHISVDPIDRTSQPNIYALGSIADGRENSMRIAEKSAEYLIERLFNYGTTTVINGMAPTLILTPLMYGFIGLTEKMAEDIIKLEMPRFQEISIYENRIDPVSEIFDTKNTRIKCLVMDNEQGYKKILGFHFLGNNVAETLQGVYAIMQSDCHVQRLDKVLSTCLNVTILQNMYLKKRISWSGDGPHTILKDSILCFTDVGLEKSGVDEEKTETESQEKDVGQANSEEGHEMPSESVISSDHIAENEGFVSESSSCPSLHSQYENDILKDKSEFLEMSFVNEKIDESSTEVSETESGSTSETSSDSEESSDSESTSETKTESENDSDSETETSSEVDTQDENEANSQVETQNENETNSQIETQNENETNSQIETQNENETKGEIETQNENETNNESETQQENETSSKTDKPDESS